MEGDYTHDAYSSKITAALPLIEAHGKLPYPGSILRQHLVVLAYIQRTRSKYGFCPDTEACSGVHTLDELMRKPVGMTLEGKICFYLPSGRLQANSTPPPLVRTYCR
jgi:hypothetical protein